MQDTPEANQRVKPGQKPPNRTWTFKHPKPPPLAKLESSAPLVADRSEALTEEDLRNAEAKMKSDRVQRDIDAAAKKESDAKAAVEAKEAADAAAAEEGAKAAAKKAKIDAKIAEVRPGPRMRRIETAPWSPLGLTPSTPRP